MRRASLLAWTATLAVALAGCGSDDGGNGNVDAGRDAQVLDAGNDAGTPMDAGSDASTPTDAGMDAMAPSDAGTDAMASMDGGGDAMSMSDGGGGDAFSCMPDAFLMCDSGMAVSCNGSGDGTVMQDCGAYGCNETAGRCNECNASTTECQGDDVVVCDADGLITTSTTCPLGCNASTAACNVLEPTNLAADTCDTMGMGNLAYGDGDTIDTDACAPPAGDGMVMAQTGGPSICIIKAATITVPAGATVTVTGGNALALVATSSLSLDGTLDASADHTMAGPGAVTDGNGGPGANRDDAGGGAGHGTDGAMGGWGTQMGRAHGAAGMMYAMASVMPLMGGSEGGNNGADTLGTFVAHGGAGGGALQLVSCGDLTLGAGAVIDVGGGGGEGGVPSIQPLAPSGGGGGGSGGAVILEAATVTLGSGAILAANGGGGGSGATAGAMGNMGLAGNPGDNGQAGSTVAMGGTAPTPSTGAGGAGGAEGTGPQPGGDASDGTTSAGGGGGAVGRIRINTAGGTGLVDNGAVTSPTADQGSVAAH